MVSQRPNKADRPDLERLRKLGVWLPAIALGVLFTLFWAHHLHNLMYIAILFVIVGMVTGGAYVFSRYVFRIVWQKEQELFQRNQELAILNAVGNVINESFHLDELLSRVLGKVLETTGADAGEIFLLDEDAADLTFRAFHGVFPEAFHEMTRLKLSQGFPGHIAQTGQPMVTYDLGSEPSFIRRGIQAAGFRSFAGVPLQSKGKIVGVMDIAALDPAKLTSKVVELLTILGNQIGVAVENARLYAQLKEMTILEERQRIAREMHDGLAQDLSYFHFKVRELEANVPVECPPRFWDELQLMKKMTASAYEDVRQAIFGLRTLSPDAGLVPSLTEYLHEFNEQTGITTDLQIVDEAATHLPLQVEIQLIRIIQEALTNVRKHARATQVQINFTAENGEATVTVHDDGQGFDPDDVALRGSASFGLQSMKERAESVKGTLSVVSEPGQGTRLTVCLPTEDQETTSWKP